MKRTDIKNNIDKILNGEMEITFVPAFRDRIKKDAERITLRRIREAEEEKAYQESQVETTLTMDDSPVEEVTVKKTVKKKGK